MKYDIFISYRRTAYDTANLIAEKLRHAGYRVFFDVDTLTSGKFNEQLLEVIANCKDFIVVLPESALERCVDKDDWIRREVTCAIEQNKNIIPIMLDGFVWPDEMPEGMEDLKNYQAITSINHEYFDMSVERLKKYLRSKPVIPFKKWILISGIVISLISIVGYSIVHHISEVACERIVSKEANVMSAVDAINDIRQNYSETTSSFFSAVTKTKNNEEREELEEEMSKSLNKIEKEIAIYKKNVPIPDFNISVVESYVLAFHNIKVEELLGFKMYYSSIYDDLDNSFSVMRDILHSHDYSQNNQDLIDIDCQMISYGINSFYYAYLGFVSLMPKSSRSTHYELSKKWRNYPNGTPLDLSQEEYEQFQAIELNHMNDLVTKLNAILNYSTQKLRDIENHQK